MTDSSNVTPAVFDPLFLAEVTTSVKQWGLVRTEKSLLENGFHPSFVKAILRKIMRSNSW